MQPKSLLAATCFTLYAAVLAVEAHAVATIAGCPSLPGDSIWNARVDTLPVHPRSAAWVANTAIAGNGASRNFHMDFGSGLYLGGPIGIPFVVVNGTQPKVPVVFGDEAGEESDPGPYPIPPNAPIEGGPNSSGDRHILVIDRDNCILYETFSSYTSNNGASWDAYSGAIYDLRSNALRTAGWTSADAAGLPIFPGLVRYDEVASGVIEHALRFTVERTQRAYVWPARHFASSSTNLDHVPMGARFRLKASVNINNLSPHARVIAQAMKTYGIINADNGSPWFVSGAPDERWDNDVLHELDFLTGNDFEAVDSSSLQVSANSGQVVGGCTAGDQDTDGIPNCIELTEGRNVAVKDNDVFASARLFAMQQYRDFLGREGESAGVAFYQQEIGSGAMPRLQAIENFLGSPEFQGGLPQCTRLYLSFFNRIPDYGGLLFQVGQFRSGVGLAAIAQNFSNSPEFTSRYGALTDDQYINLVYQNVLGRAPDPQGYDFYFTRLQSGALTRGQMMIGFSESPEFQLLMAEEVYVIAVYVGMLRRAPEPAGLDFYVDQIEGGAPSNSIINGFLGSPEYRSRFLP